MAVGSSRSSSRHPESGDRPRGSHNTWGFFKRTFNLKFPPKWWGRFRGKPINSLEKRCYLGFLCHKCWPKNVSIGLSVISSNGYSLIEKKTWLASIPHVQKQICFKRIVNHHESCQPFCGSTVSFGAFKNLKKIGFLETWFAKKTHEICILQISQTTKLSTLGSTRPLSTLLKPPPFWNRKSTELDNTQAPKKHIQQDTAFEIWRWKLRMTAWGKRY